MAINVSFNGATIYCPGSYSKTNIDLGGGFPLGPAGLIAVIGEADAGAPGAQEVNIANNRFQADQISSIRNKYRSGPIADAAAMLFAPAADAAIPGGAQTVWFYKTNASVRASLALATTYGTARATEWGVGGNKVSVKNVLISETPATTVSSAAFDETLLTTGQTLVIHVNGMTAYTFTVPAGAPPVFATNAALAAGLALASNWAPSLPAGMTGSVGGVDGASTITIAMAAAPTAHQNGWGRSFEISGTMLTTANLVAGLKTPAVEPSATLTLNQTRDGISESDSLGGNVVLSIGHDGSGGVTSASVTIDATNITLTTNLGSQVLPKGGFAILKEVVDEINLASYNGWSASLSSSLYNQLSPSVLDEVTTVGALSATSAKPARLKKDASDVADFFAESSMASLENAAVKGLPDALIESLLAGGARGATSPASIVAALEKFEKFHVNAIVPLFSWDATDDIADGATDPASTYTIAGIHQAVKTHISLMKTTKKRSERQGYLSLKDTFANCKTVAGDLADGREQLLIQDVRQSDAQGNIKWFQPWALASLLAGARGGAPIGEPMTFKFLNCSGIRHAAQPMSTPDADIIVDFDPDLQTDEAIQSGLTFLENPQNGGFRVVVDNTTYGRDGNFVWNRANVIYAADIVAFNLRNSLEAVYVGKKNTVSVADIAGVASTILNGFLTQGITVSTPDAPQGFKNLVVRLEGNTIYVEVTIKIVEGIDFVLSEITIQRATA
jgi:hypothetical protein